LIWIGIHPKRRVEIGSIAGHQQPGSYRLIGINYRVYKAHQLAWFWMTGSWPIGWLDHRNLDKSDNRWHNLRLATGQQNGANRRARNDSRLGIKGVYQIGQRFRAYLGIGGKNIHLGYFSNVGDASAAYEAAVKSAYGEYARA
jgi:hypothetical protein